ncbi:MAG: hypothetical protein Rubg2KO_39870 [Rubricoccaceae bacterium]
MRTPFRLSVLAALVLALAACGGGDDAAPEEEEGGLMGALSQANQVRESVNNMQEQMERMEEQGSLEPADPVDFRQLRDLLQESVAGLDRGETEGSKDGAMGFTISKASASYADGADASATVTVTDMGGIQMAMMFGLAWTMAEIDRESGTKIERTMEYEGYPAYLEFDSDGGRGSLQVLVADRFVVEATGNGLTEDQLEELVQSVGLNTLEGWRDEGRGEA